MPRRAIPDDWDLTKRFSYTSFQDEGSCMLRPPHYPRNNSPHGAQSVLLRSRRDCWEYDEPADYPLLVPVLWDHSHKNVLPV